MFFIVEYFSIVKGWTKSSIPHLPICESYNMEYNLMSLCRNMDDAMLESNDSTFEIHMKKKKKNLTTQSSETS
jgi:hypothetical protein